MTTTLVQRRLLAVQELEIGDDSVQVRIKAPFREEERLSVFLTVLSPEPVITPSRLEFNSRVNGEPLLSLYPGKPNPREFNAFVATLKERAQAAYDAFTGMRSAPEAETPPGNLADAPADLDDGEDLGTTKVRGEVDVDALDTSIRMLRTYLEGEHIAPLLSALEALRADPGNEARRARLGEVFAALGPAQGAVLTYAPYIIVLLSDDPFGREPE